MDVTRMIDLGSASVPDEVKNALAWNSKLVDSEYVPPIEGEIRTDGSVAAFISADNKAIMFFDECKRTGKCGKIINDDVTFHSFGADLVMVQAKASIFVDDILKGTAVAGQVFRIGDVEVMDRVVQYASGLAKSRALTNAGYGVVSAVTIPAPSGSLDPAGSGQPGAQSVPFQADNLQTGLNAQRVGNSMGYGGNMDFQSPVAAPAAPQPAADDLIVWAKGIHWPKYKKYMGELMLNGDGIKAIIWAAEKMSANNDIKKAALILYPEACRLAGVAPKAIK